MLDVPQTTIFIYPYGNQFGPLDDLAQQIVAVLARQGFRKAYIDVEFDTYGGLSRNGSEINLFTKVKEINSVGTGRPLGCDFSLHFGGVQGLLPGGVFNDTAGLDEIWIPGKKLNLWEDTNSFTLYTFVGKAPKTVGWMPFTSWINTPNPKLNKQPRQYLEYQGSDEQRGYCRYDSERYWPRYLSYTDDLGRAYAPQGKEPTYYETADVIEEFRTYLEAILHFVSTEKSEWVIPLG